jgi:hypothetical protein
MSIQIQISSLIELSEQMLVAANHAEWLELSKMDRQRRQQVMRLESGEPSTHPIGLAEKLQTLKGLDEDIREIVEQAKEKSGEEYHALIKDRPGLSMYQEKIRET